MAEALTPQTSASASSGGRPFAFSLSGLSLTSVNRVLGVLTALTLAFFLITLVIGGVKLIGVGQHIRGLEAKGVKAAKPSEERETVKAAAVDPQLSNRNIFQPAGAASSALDAGSSVMSPAAGYKLVGISQAQDPSETYVMVENSQTKLTYFLQYGQSVEGLELERILEDKVIVKIGGKSVELE